MLPGGTDLSCNDSLPGLMSSASSDAPVSLSQITGEREMGHPRILLPRLGDAFEVSALPPLRTAGQDPVLQCPFRFCGCLLDFVIGDDRQWVEHSLTHFKTEGGRRPQRVDPPKKNTCHFCEQTFEDQDGQESWEVMMRHVRLFHHKFGHLLAHSRLDYDLVGYLWRKKVVSNAEYRELMSNEQASQSSPPPLSPDGDFISRGAYTVLNERRSRA